MRDPGTIRPRLREARCLSAARGRHPDPHDHGCRSDWTWCRPTRERHSGARFYGPVKPNAGHRGRTTLADINGLPCRLWYSDAEYLVPYVLMVRANRTPLCLYLKDQNNGYHINAEMGDSRIVFRLQTFFPPAGRERVRAGFLLVDGSGGRVRCLWSPRRARLVQIPCRSVVSVLHLLEIWCSMIDGTGRYIA